jgi:hypothetical protein
MMIYLHDAVSRKKLLVKDSNCVFYLLFKTKSRMILGIYFECFITFLNRRLILSL